MLTASFQSVLWRFFSVCTRLWNDDPLRSFGGEFESGTWIIYDSKLLNLENLEVESDTSDAIHIVRNLCPGQTVDPNASVERNTRMDQNKEALAQLVSTVDIDHVKSKNQEEGILDEHKPLILLKSDGVETSTTAQDAQVE